MRMDDGRRFRTRRVDIAMETPFRRRRSCPLRLAGKRHFDDVGWLHGLVPESARRDEEAASSSCADITRRAAIDTQGVHAQRAIDDSLPRGDVAHCARSGKRLASPSALAAQMPRSVMSPLSSRAGVTSKASFMTRVSFGAIKPV